MGAWGAGNFENDDAKDFVHEVVNLAGPDVLTEAIQFVADADEMICIEAPVAARALAAAEFVAAARGRPAPDWPENAAQWLAANKPEYDATVIAAAQKAIQRVATASQLQELWDETDSAEPWHAVLADLQQRLQG